jgi:hypothetical protein
MDFENHIKRFGHQYLVDKGFSQVAPWVFEKPLDGLCQGVGFVKGERGLQGRFTVDLFWRYTNTPLDQSWAMHCCRRIGSFYEARTAGFLYHFKRFLGVRPPSGWYPIDEDKSYTAVAGIFSSAVEPFFKAHESIADVIRSFEDGRYTDFTLFGPDAGWRKFHIGFCYLSIGNKEKAIEYLTAVVEKHSDWIPNWVQERKQIAAEELKRLQQG